MPRSQGRLLGAFSRKCQPSPSASARNTRQHPVTSRTIGLCQPPPHPHTPIYMFIRENIYRLAQECDALPVTCHTPVLLCFCPCAFCAFCGHSGSLHDATTTATSTATAVSMSVHVTTSFSRCKATREIREPPACSGCWYPSVAPS